MREFVAWIDEGKYCGAGSAFGIGKTILEALMRYRRGIPALECGGVRKMDNGNGSLMRIFPFVLATLGQEEQKQESWEVFVREICDASRLTHAHPVSYFSCLFFSFFLRELFQGRNIGEAYERTRLIMSAPYWGANR